VSDQSSFEGEQIVILNTISLGGRKCPELQTKKIWRKQDFWSMVSPTGIDVPKIELMMSYMVKLQGV
jgi:hypothetical protein